ncbi:AAA family ATPase [Polaromonas sp.]|uniref:AAA family ATPase n=1 Tax=Polaromonas sp. TaxID=1869339 RepID=UPI003263F1EB
MTKAAEVFAELEPGPIPPQRRKPKQPAPLIYQPPPPTRIRDITELLMSELTPVQYVIPGWLPEGLTMLVASPKIGKSTLMLQIEVALATGGTFWGEDVPAGRVLMIDLETNERRLRRKLVEAGIVDLPEGMLRYATDWPKGLLGVEQIAQCLEEDPSIRLVVIDTLQRFRDSGTGKQNAYAADYEALAPLQQLCRDTPGLAIVCVHHKRKAASDDPIDSINGSAAIAGAADGIWIMSRKGSEYTLHIQARDWEKDEDEFSIVREAGKWQLVDGPRFTENEREVLGYLDVAGGMTGPQLGEALKVSRQAALSRLNRMRDRGAVVFREGSWHVA